MAKSATAARWMSLVMLAASVYHVLLGVWAVTQPLNFSGWSGMLRPANPEIGPVLGIAVAVLGVGFAMAAFDPIRHWPIILVGLALKVFGSLGLTITLVSGSIPPTIGLPILTGDLIWWIPFGMILWQAFHKIVTRSYLREEALPLKEALSSYSLTNGMSLAESSRKQPVLMCFLRHFG